jgi:predicted lipoprotein with Yx(FWY)xxD motif
MAQPIEHQELPRRVSRRRIAAAALTVGGLSTSIFAVGTAGATADRTAKSTVVSTVTSTKFGKVLESGGKALYTLKASKTACTAQCVKIWPELLLPKGVTKATASGGVSGSRLGTMKRSGGVLQVTYGGKPVYFFSGDTTSGQVNGNVTDEWGKWSAVVTAKPTSSTGSGSGGSNAGSGGVSF